MGSVMALSNASDIGFPKFLENIYSKYFIFTWLKYFLGDQENDFLLKIRKTMTF